MFVCTFAGHREVYHSCVDKCVRLLIDMILDQHDNVMFYNGGMGAFDDICAKAVNAAKMEYPQNSIQNILIRDFGGAYDMARYAVKNGIRVINVAGDFSFDN